MHFRVSTTPNLTTVDVIWLSSKILLALVWSKTLKYIYVILNCLNTGFSEDAPVPAENYCFLTVTHTAAGPPPSGVNKFRSLWVHLTVQKPCHICPQIKISHFTPLKYCQFFPHGTEHGIKYRYFSKYCIKEIFQYCDSATQKSVLSSEVCC